MDGISNCKEETLNTSASARSRVLVFIPAFNEEKNIARVVQGVFRSAPDADVLVINDGSTDATTLEACRAGATVVNHIFNMGYGAACQTGFKYACRHGYDYLVQIDGDGQHETSCIADMLATVKEPGVDVVLGSRWLGEVKYDGPILRKFGKFFFGFFASLITHHDVTDPTTGFQALSRPVFKFFCTNVYPVDYPDADVIIMLDKAGFKVKEVPVIMYRDETGHSMHSGLLRPLYYGLKMMMSITMTILRNDRNLRLQKSPHSMYRLAEQVLSDG